tara:strand:- start:17 stop:430 length:414 start_codon:yes stop_codon:yes gene_type:complete
MKVFLILWLWIQNLIYLYTKLRHKVLTQTKKNQTKMLESTKNTITKEVIETINALTQYANEDISILKNEGCMSVTGTENGCMDLTFINDVFSKDFHTYSAIGRKRNLNGQIEITNLLKFGTEKELKTLLMTSYIIEA